MSSEELGILLEPTVGHQALLQRQQEQMLWVLRHTVLPMLTHTADNEFRKMLHIDTAVPYAVKERVTTEDYHQVEKVIEAVDAVKADLVLLSQKLQYKAGMTTVQPLIPEEVVIYNPPPIFKPDPAKRNRKNQRPSWRIERRAEPIPVLADAAYEILLLCDGLSLIELLHQIQRLESLKETSPAVLLATLHRGESCGWFVFDSETQKWKSPGYDSRQPE